MRDGYTRRRVLEQHYAGVLQHRWRVRRFWRKLQYKLSARRIAHTYSLILKRRAFNAKVEALRENNLIKKIQRRFRTSIMRFGNYALILLKFLNFVSILAFPCMKIQRCYRHHLHRRKLARRGLENRAATAIQRILRGYLVRVSDKFMLAQIYLRLPPFWKELMHLQSKSSNSQSEVLICHQFLNNYLIPLHCGIV